MINPDGTVTDAQALRQLVGTGAATLARWATQGCPVPAQGPIPVRPVLAWLMASRKQAKAQRLRQAIEAHEQVSAAAGATPHQDDLSTLDDAALRRERQIAQTRLARLEAAQAEGSLLPLARVKAALSAYSVHLSSLFEQLIRVELLEACDGHPAARAAVLAAHERGKARLRVIAATHLRSCITQLTTQKTKDRQ